MWGGIRRRPELHDSSHSMKAGVIFVKMMDISFWQPLHFLSCPDSPVCHAALCVLKCSEGGGNHILASTSVSLTTLKLLSCTVSFFAVAPVVLPACSSQKFTPLIIVEVPLSARRLLNCNSTLASSHERKNKILFTFHQRKFTRNIHRLLFV